jgi:hypothetical protein
MTGAAGDESPYPRCFAPLENRRLCVIWRAAACGILMLGTLEVAQAGALARTQVIDLPPNLEPVAAKPGDETAAAAVYARAARTPTPENLFGPLYVEVEQRAALA